MTLRVDLKKRINRSAAVCRAQARDMAHHIRANVHKSLKYTILHTDAVSCRVRAETRLLGMKQVDELELREHADGSVTQSYLSGSNQGAVITFRFETAGEDATWVMATAEVPVSGIKKLLRVFLARTLRNLGLQALEEDRADLEEGNYQPPAVEARAA